VPTIVHEVLRSSGRPLDPATRAFFDPRFGHHFSRVGVHAGRHGDRSMTEPGDPSEREADQAADAVMRMPGRAGRAWV
jgi:hypothetical protein